jgi:cytochrome P450
MDVGDILGFDPFDPDFHHDPYRHYRRLAMPLSRTPFGLWVTTSHPVCQQILRDQRFGHQPGKDVETVWRTAGSVRRRSFLTFDPPEHTRLRRLVSKAFTARFVERLRPRIEDLVQELLNAAEGDVDLISTLAYPLPVAVISELLGVPAADSDRFRRWSDALARGLDPDFLLPPEQLAAREEARQEFTEYFRELSAERRASPRPDLLSSLVAVSSDGGETLSETDLLATCVLLLVAGHETTVNLIGNGTLALLRHPDDLQRLRSDPSLVPSAVEELLRYDSPIQFSARVALTDAEICGERIEAGQVVLLVLGAANRDPSVFADPDRLDIDRRPAGHLAFGMGIHFCLGAPLARLEGQIALTALAKRDLTLLEEHPKYRENIILRGLESLPVHLTARSLTEA